MFEMRENKFKRYQSGDGLQATTTKIQKINSEIAVNETPGLVVELIQGEDAFN